MWTAKDFETNKGRWSAIDFGGESQTDPINKLPPQQRDKAEAARRSKMGTTKNMNDSVVTSVQPKTTFLQKTGNTIKNIITDPLGSLERGAGKIDQALAKSEGVIGRNLDAGMARTSSNILNSIPGGYESESGPALQIKENAARAIPRGDNTILGQVIQTVPQTAGALYTSLATGGGKALPFLFSLSQAYGGAYGQARDEGVDHKQARNAALLQGIPQAAIEVMGGVENLIGKSAGKGFLKTVGRAALEEGLEEVFQYPFEGLAKKATYAPDTKWFSTKEDAVINPIGMGQNALVGGLAGGLFGGATNVMTNVMTNGVRLPKPKQQTQQAPIQAEQQTRPMPIPKKPDFYTDTYGNTATDINASRQMPQAPLMLPPSQTELTRGMMNNEVGDMSVTIPFRKNLEKAPIMANDEFAQSIEPKGDYINFHDPEWGTLPNYEYGNITFKKPLVIEYETTGHGGWKTKLSEKYGGKTGLELSNAIKKDGYDGVITIDSKGKEIMEVVNLSGQKNNIGKPVKVNTYEDIVSGEKKIMTNQGLNNQPFILPENRFSPNRITPANLAALNRRGLNPEVQKLSDRLNPPIQKPVEPILKPTQQAQQQKNTSSVRTGKAIWRNKDFDQPVEVTGYAGKYNGKDYVNIKDSKTAIPLDEITYAQQEAAPTVEQTPQPRQESPILQQRKKAELLRKEYEQIKATSKLTPDELTIADNIRKGKLSAVPQGFNAQVINEVANAGRLYDQADGEVKAFNENRKQMLRDTMDGLLEGSDNAKDKSGAFLSREIQERNSIDVFGEETGKKINETIFRPVHDNEAKKTRFINKYVERVKNMNLSKAESQAVQMLGEGKIAEHELPANMDKAKIKNAVAEFRKIYDNLLSLANEILVNNGYAPVEYRKDYFPHFDSPTDPFVKAMKNLGFKVDNITLPTDIAGITHQFRPGKKWFGNFLRREGTNTTYDALEGFERYLYGISDVIYHTNDIQRLRAFETAIRSKYAPDNIKNRITEIEQSGLSADDQQAAIDALFEIDKGHLGSYVTDLRAYTDNLAGKKSISDRNMEHKMGRAAYNIFDNMNTQVARNMVGFNVSSWLTNFIPLAQAGAGIKTKNFIKAANDTVLNYYKDDGFVNKSTFLTNRKGTERLTQTTVQKIADAGMKPMQMIDEFTSQILVRGKYLEGIENGLSHKEAMQKADSYVAGAMADRSKGSMPTAFNTKNPITKLVTMFQLEVNNQFSFLFKDLPREAKKLGGKWLATTLLKFMVGSFIYNELYEKLTGRRPTIDPIGTVKRAIESETPLASIGKDVMEQTPFVGGILPSALGISQGGGRLPLGAALPDFQDIGNAAKDIKEDGWSLKNAGNLASGVLKNPATYLLSPFGGGGQAKKTIEGLKAFGQGASLSDTGRMRYPIPKTLPNALRTGLFGQYSTPEAREYFDKNRTTLSPNQTQQVMSSEDPQQAYLRIMQERQINSLNEKLKKIDADDTLTRAEKDKKIIEIREKIIELRN